MNDTTSHQDTRLSRPARLRSLQLGEIRVSYVPDGAVQLSPTGWLPTSTDADWAAHPEFLDETGNLVGSIGSLLVERGGRALLIDTGFGPWSAPAEPGNPYGAIHGGALLDNLAALGRAPADIEAVAITHLHIDHVGWAWRPGADGLAFGAVPHLIAEYEWAHRDLAADGGVGPEILDVFAPRVRTVAADEEIFPGVRVFATPGHTAGHTGYAITGGGRRLLAFGDALHSPIQFDHPDWPAAVDHDTEASERSRRHVIAELSRPGTIGFGVHFADVVFGRLGADGDGPAWRPVAD